MADMTHLDHAEVANTANDLRDLAKQMEGLFEDFTKTVKDTTQEDVLKGQTGSTVEERFADLKPKFAEFVELVNSMAKDIDTNNTAWEQTDAAVANAGQDL